ncbi:MAG: hypothetical protein EOO63_10885 [Hymenobacter sp.]|nr:MAG: hypothetical protein EOO63_10885 [Hymenobacter sp.]
MLKRFTPLLTLLLGLVACYGFLAAKAPTPAAKVYDYVGLTYSGAYLQIATAPDKLESVKIKTEHNLYDGNVGPLLAKANEFEAQGYELIDQTAYISGGIAGHYMLLRRLRP